jgi:trans-aconitate 2-methyltransferase
LTARAGKSDWNPEAYARFRGLRLRPALDLMAQVGDLPAGDVVDLGCGDGAAAEALAMTFGRDVVGVDASPAMLSKAEGYAAKVLTDIGSWQPAHPPALIFSNAALQWLPDHPALIARLVGFLPKGGWLAVQMPMQSMAPSHRFLRDIAAAMFPEIFDFTGYQPPVQRAEDYAVWLRALGRVNVWESLYVQQLQAEAGMHPVRAFTGSTAMRPIVEKLTGAQAEAFQARYDAALAAAYPLQADGSVLFPFRRVFFTVQV